MLTRVNVESWLGTPYKRKGTDRSGIDCFNLCRALNREIGQIDLPPFESPDPDDPKQWSIIDRIIRDAKSGFERLAEPEQFCLVTFIIYPPYITHIGFVLEDKRHFLHILNKKQGVTIGELDSLSWRHRIEGYYRYAG